MIPIVNTTTMITARTPTGVRPCMWMSLTVSAPSAATNSRAIVRTSRRKRSVDRRGRPDLPAPGRPQLDRQRAEREPADVGEVRHAPATAGRRGEADGREHRLLGEPDSE